MLNKKIKIDGLDCANCANKIENKLTEVKNISDANVDFVSKTISFNYKNENNIQEIMENIRVIVKKIEPDAKLIEPIETNATLLNEQVIQLEGLSCANCAAKIENKIRSINGVENVSVNYATQKIILETQQGINESALNNNIVKIAKLIEPNIKLTFTKDEKDKVHNHDKNKHDEHDDHNHDENDGHSHEGGSEIKGQIIKFVIGSLIFAIGVIFNFDPKVEFVIFAISYLIVGGEIVLRAIKGIANGQIFSEHFLMSIATIGAFIIGEYPEGVAVMLFYLLGELFQDLAVDHSRKSIRSLMDIRPDYANLIVGENIQKVSPETVNIDDVILVKPGEKIPLDGIVVDGSSMVDTAALTGESIPRELEVGGLALSGFINKNGVLSIRVTKSFGESTVSKILELVENASSRKAPTEKYISKFAAIYTPVVVFSALALAVIPPLLIPGELYSTWVYRALVFLVISCPCALVISIPLGFFGGIGGASKRGILVKGSNYLEALNNVEMIVFDKTGTLTKGVFAVTEIFASENYSKDEVLKFAAYAESFSNHPIALSIQKAFSGEVDKTKIENYNELSGFGIKINLDNKLIIVGNSKLLTNENINFKEMETMGSVVYVAVDNVYAGCIVISDEIKEDAQLAIKGIKSLGITKTVMLTGDRKVVGDKIGKEIGVDIIYSELLPVNKVEKLEELEKSKSKKGKIVFVGDGINDAPVLARADIGIAMGALGSDAAIEAADIVIMTDEPSKIVTAIKIARKTRTIVYQNILLALCVKGLFLVLGAFGVATMWEAVFADTGVALLAVFNALRVMNTKSL